MKKIISMIILSLMMVSLFASEAASIAELASAIDTASLISGRDSRTTYENPTMVDLSTVEDAYEINDEGIFLLQGKLDGKIIINTSKKVQLVLDGANITNAKGPAIEITKADKVFITVASPSSLSSSGFEDEKIDGAIYSKADLTVNGSALLTINSANNGIVVKDSLVLYNANLKIDAQNHGLDVNDSIAIARGSYTINSAKDAIHCEEEENMGYIYIQGGTFVLTSQGDGIDSSSEIIIENGNFNITSGGGSSKAVQKANEMDFKGWSFNTVAEDESTSTKAIKADGLITIGNGTFVIDSCDDSIHSNSNVLINQANITISSGDDGIHADNQLQIKQGNINILKSYEGLEGTLILIEGGTIVVNASDDGINASDGTTAVPNMQGRWGGGMGPMQGSSNCFILLSGGQVTVNAFGDGIDSNGGIQITGGYITVYGPTNSGNGALDYDSSCDITGGTLIALGSSGMAQGLSSTVQPTILFNTTNQNANSTVTLKSGSKVILSTSSPKNYSSVVISSPDLQLGETYTLGLGSTSQTISLTSLNYSNNRNTGNNFRTMPGRFF